MSFSASKQSTFNKSEVSFASCFKLVLSVSFSGFQVLADKMGGCFSFGAMTRWEPSLSLNKLNNDRGSNFIAPNFLNLEFTCQGQNTEDRGRGCFWVLYESERDVFRVVLTTCSFLVSRLSR